MRRSVDKDIAQPESNPLVPLSGRRDLAHKNCPLTSHVHAHKQTNVILKRHIRKVLNNFPIRNLNGKDPAVRRL